ncbi:hypothetical protein AgCh_031337 [Apium graveolens]
MESVHVVFDDKMIEGLQDGDFHESLKFDNIEMICENSDDESDQEPISKDNVEKSITNEAHNSTSTERHAHANFKVYRMDVKNAHLNGDLEEEFYVSQPPCSEDPIFPEYVYYLLKELYGLKQASRAWYDTLSKFLLENHFTRVKQVSDGILISQTKYISNLLKKFDLMDCTSAKTPMTTTTKLELNATEKSMDISSYRGMVGSLLYLTASRPDIMFATCLCARFLVDPRESHLIAIKRIFRYLKGTPKLGIWYPRDSGFDLTSYSDADYAAEAEYIAAGSCFAQILWMKNQLLDYGLQVNKIPIFCDNTSAIAITENPVQHSRTKHIDIKYHFIREHVMNGTVELHFVPSEIQLADIFTKPLDEFTFSRQIEVQPE